MSGYTDDAIAQHGVLEEGLVLVNKPIKGEILASRIREVMDAKLNQKSVIAKDHDINGLKILLVDDNEDIRSLVQVYIKNYNCMIDIAENGNIAVGKFRSGQYDIVLMDMQMPVMDGLTAVREMRTWENENGSAETTIIAMTGNSDKEAIDECLNAGYTNHIAKPIKKDLLINTLLANSSPTFITPCDTEEIQNEKILAHVDPDLKDLIPEYLEERQSDISKIQEAIKIKDYETVSIVGHTLKGSGGGFGFDPINEIGMHIETAAKEEDYEDIEKWNNKLSDYLENVEIVYE